MEISIANFRGIKNACFDVDNIAIIGGENGAGKTSIAQAIGSAITGECPVKDLKKQDYKHLVKIGKTTANIEVKTDSGRSVMQFPDGKGYTEGTPIFSSAYAVGLNSPLDMKKTDAAECWIGLLKAEPTLKSLRSELEKENAFDIEDILQAVKAKGWDGATAKYKEEGAKLKGQWEYVTGERYGTSKGESYMPSGFTVSDTKEGLEAAVQAKEKAYEESLKKNAVSQHERDNLTEKSETLKGYEAELEKRNNGIAGLQKELESAKANLQKAQDVANVYKCPHCDNPVRIENGKLIKAVAAKTDIKIEELQSKVNQAQKSLNEELAKISNLKFLIKEAETAKQKLSNSIVSEINNTAATELQTAKEALHAFNAFAEAKQKHEKIISYISVLKILAPDGLRKRCLDSALRSFNDTLKELCEEAEWGLVVIEPDLSVSYEEKPFALLSESEQYRTRCTIQAAIAIADKSQLLIFDRADLLTKKGRNGLFYLCQKTGLYAIICLSANEKSEIPNLTTDGNSTYWVENETIMGAWL